MDPNAFRMAPVVAILAAVGFILLAFILLYPVWKFMNREEELSKKWTEEEIQKALKREGKDANGSPLEEDEIDLSGDGK